MKSAILRRMAPVALLIGTGMIGCSPTARTPHPAFASQMPQPEQFGARAAARARAALAERDATGAIAAAEIAVAAQPMRADYRALLGQSYLDGGRFASAAQAFGDALSIDPTTPRAAFGRALALLGSGNMQAAHAAITALPGSVPASDRGLALALAGDVNGALAMLEPAARAAGADSRTRQNLALAYAMNGDWAKASATAAQDVSPADLPARLAGWAQFAQTTAGPDKVALLLGTGRVEDAGMPAQLALATSTPSALASNAALPAEPAPVMVAAGPAPAAAVVLSPAAPVMPQFASQERAPLIASRAEVRLAAAAFNATPPLLRAEPAPFKRAVVRTPAPTVRMTAFAAPRGGAFVVQLGAFRNPARIERAWAESTARLAKLASFTPSSTSFLSATHGSSLTRLSIAGFNSHQSAEAVCLALRATGGACFVRQVAGDNPVHWASRDTDRRAV